MHRRLAFLAVSTLLSLTTLVLGCAVAQPPSSAPGVIVASPPSASIYTVGEQVVVQSVSTDPSNILRVALVVDGIIVREDVAPVATGQQQLAVMQAWTADTVGQHNLIVRATNAQGVTTQAGIYVTVQAAAVMTATIEVPTFTIPTATPPAAPATLALPELPTQIPAITVIVTATPQNTATPSPTVPATATLAPTRVPATRTPINTTAPEVSTASAPATATATNAPPLVNANACSGQPDAFTFTASAASITAGQSVSLNWSAVTNASIAVLNGGAFNGQGVGAPGAINTSPTATTTYTLTATCGNGGGTRNATVTVTVKPNAVVAAPTPTDEVKLFLACVGGNPTISSFTASADTVAADETVTVSWNSTGANQVFLSSDNFSNQEVEPSGSRTFTMLTTSTFTLSANCTPTGKTASAQVNVTVTNGCSGKPGIAFFDADKNPVNHGESVSLNWGDVTNADEIHLSGIFESGTHEDRRVTAPDSLMVTAPDFAGITKMQYELTALCTTSGTSATIRVVIDINP